MNSCETYTLGYSHNAVGFMARRTIESHAAFVMPRLKAGWRVLDCGCGPGTVTLGLARMVFPGEVIAIDQEPSQLELARQNAAAAQVTNVGFQNGSVYELPFADEQFDLVFAHAVFEHLKEPAAALGQIRRVLKPGGTVALRSPDWGGFLFWPGNPRLEAAIEYYKMLQNGNGGDVYAGRKLKALLAASGFQNVCASATYESVQPLEVITEFIAQRIEESAAKNAAIERGWITVSKLQESAAALRELQHQPGGFFAIAWCEVLGVK